MRSIWNANLNPIDSISSWNAAAVSMEGRAFLIAAILLMVASGIAAIVAHRSEYGITIMRASFLATVTGFGGAIMIGTAILTA